MSRRSFDLLWGKTVKEDKPLTMQPVPPSSPGDSSGNDFVLVDDASPKKADPATGEAAEELALHTPDEPAERRGSAVLSLQTNDAAHEEWLARLWLGSWASRDRAARKPPSRAPSGQLTVEEDDIKAQLAQVMRENERLKLTLDDCSSQHEWALSSVIKSAEAEKADLAIRLQEMEDQRDTLEQELKHSEAQFVGLVGSLLDQKLGHFGELLHENLVAISSAAGTPRSSFHAEGGAEGDLPQLAEMYAAKLGLHNRTVDRADIESITSQVRAAIMKNFASLREAAAPDGQPGSPDSARSAVSVGPIGSEVAPARSRPLATFFGALGNAIRDDGPRALRAAKEGAGRALRVPMSVCGPRLRAAGDRCRQLHERVRENGVPGSRELHSILVVSAVSVLALHLTRVRLIKEVRREVWRERLAMAAVQKEDYVKPPAWSDAAFLDAPCTSDAEGEVPVDFGPTEEGDFPFLRIPHLVLTWR